MERSLSLASSEAKTGSEQQPEQARTDTKVPHATVSEDKPHSEKPGRSFSVFALLLFYSALALISWIILYIQTDHPLTTAQYGTFKEGWRSDLAMQSAYDRNQDWFHAAKIMQSLLAAFTIPMTGAVVARAAVVLAQTPKANLTLRQTSALSDHAWSDPIMIYRLLAGRVQRYTSSLMLVAIVVNLLGILVVPLQAYYTVTIVAKRPFQARSVTVTSPIDILAALNFVQDDKNLVSVMTRSAITSASLYTSQGNIWSNQTSHLRNTFADLPQLAFPYYAPLPLGTSTGLLRQFSPRINSSATRTNLTLAESPKNCGTLPGSFYVQYQHSSPRSANYYGNWSVTACMPDKLTSTPWQVTGDRQDISERLFLDITNQPFFASTNDTRNMYMITLNTTLGFFELPNYANGNMAGPLLDKSPFGQTTTGYAAQPPIYTGYDKRDLNNGTAGMTDSTVLLETVRNKGPLLALAFALFGEGSFIADSYQNRDAFGYSSSTQQQSDNSDPAVGQAPNTPTCVEQVPLMGLLSSVDGYSYSNYPGCLLGKQGTTAVDAQVQEWLKALGAGSTDKTVENAFSAGAYLANEAWLNYGAGHGGSSLSVTSDMGADTEKPAISRTGKVVVSVILGLYLASLYVLAFYAISRPTWTRTLDAFTMMRIGAALRDEMPLRYAPLQEEVKALDDLPGWIGDASGGEGDLGVLGVGAIIGLQNSRPLRAYERKIRFQ